MALTLTDTQAATLFAETLYQQRLSASLRDESTTSIPLGIPSSDAVELLESDRMVAFLGRLRDAYPGAAIIVDASSVLHAADPLVLARGVDGVVLVVRADRTPRDEVRRAIEVLGSKRVLGLVLNDSAT